MALVTRSCLSPTTLYLKFTFLRMARKRKNSRRRKGNGNGSNTNQAVAQRTPLPRAMRARGGGASNSAIAHAICSLTDPFCSASAGVRWPDDSSAVTIPFRAETLFTMATNATGDAVIAICPGFPYNALGYATVVAGTVTFNGSYSSGSGPNQTFASTSVSNIRCVSFGITVEGIASATASSGFMVLQEVAHMPSVSTTASTPDATGGRAAIGNLRTTRATWVSNPRGPDAHVFGAVSSTTVIPTNMLDWTACLVHIAGGPASATNVALIRAVGNYEFTVDMQDVLYSVGKATPPKPALIAAAAQMRSSVGSIFEGGAAAFTNYLEKKAMEIGVRVASSAAGYVMGGPRGAVIGASNSMLMDMN